MKKDYVATALAFGGLVLLLAGCEFLRTEPGELLPSEDVQATAEALAEEFAHGTATPIPTDTPISAPTATPTPIRLGMRAVAPPDFQGNLADYAWQDGKGYYLRVPYQGQVVNPVFGFVWDASYTNFKYEATFEIQNPGGALADISYICVLFGYEDANNFFKFCAANFKGNLYAMQARYKNGEFGFISQPSPVAEIPANLSSYALQGTYEDGKYYGWINGIQVLEANMPSDYAGGNLGFAAFTYQENSEIYVRVRHASIIFQF